jgi:hypothetical protein
MHLYWEILCEGTSHKIYEREKGKFKKCKNALFKKLFKGTGSLFVVKRILTLYLYKKFAGVLL